MAYLLKDLVRAREFRKDKATDILIKSKTALKIAQETLEKEKRVFEIFMEKKPEEVRKIFDKIMLKDVKREAMDFVQFDLTRLDNKQTELQNKVKTAESNVLEAEKNVEHAKKDLLKKEQELKKLEEHRVIWLEEEKKLEEENLEKEMEDFRVKAPESFD